MTRRTNQLNQISNKFSPEPEAKYTLSYKFYSLSLEKIDVCPGHDLETFYSSEANG